MILIVDGDASDAGTLDQAIDRTGTVKKAVVAVAMQMNEGTIRCSFTHRMRILPNAVTPRLGVERS